MSDFVWFFVIMLALGGLSAGSWVAWYALVRYNQRVRHAREVQVAATRGLPSPDPPAPPNVLHFWLRMNGIGALIGLIAAAGALSIAALGNCGHR